MIRFLAILAALLFGSDHHAGASKLVCAQPDRAALAVEALATLERVPWSAEYRATLSQVATEAGYRAGVDPVRLLALCWQESRCLPRTSPDGCACGVAQVRSDRCIPGRPTCDQLLDPATGFRWAAERLARRPDLAAYAGGDGGAARTVNQRYAARHEALYVSLCATVLDCAYSVP